MSTCANLRAQLDVDSDQRVSVSPKKPEQQKLGDVGVTATKSKTAARGASAGPTTATAPDSSKERRKRKRGKQNVWSPSPQGKKFKMQLFRGGRASDKIYLDSPVQTRRAKSEPQESYAPLSPQWVR